MPTLQNQDTVPFSAKQMFDLVADVKSYPEFLPWVVTANVSEYANNTFIADLTIGAKGARHTYRSHVTLYPETLRINAVAQEGLFSKMQTTWLFSAAPQNMTLIHFNMDYTINNWLLSKIIDPLLDSASTKIISSFHMRAHHLHSHLITEKNNDTFHC